MNPANNPPVTAATFTAAIVGLLAAFTTLGADQLAAIGAAVGIVAAIAIPIISGVGTIAAAIVLTLT